MTAEETRATVNEWYELFLAYCDAGFTEDQAMQLLCKPVVVINHASPPPEQYEFMERQNALATKLMTEMDQHD